MDTNATANQDDLDVQIKEQFKKLPPVVRDAITSADIQQKLRALADTYKLHLDQWQLLENDVMLTLLGLQETDELPQTLKEDLEIPDELARSLSENISQTVFQPIRQQLERELDNPDAKAATVSGVEAARQSILAEGSEAPATPTPVVAAAPSPVVAAPIVAPATPPAPAPEQKAARAPISTSYNAGEPSSARPTVTDDPYREPPV